MVFMGLPRCNEHTVAGDPRTDGQAPSCRVPPQAGITPAVESRPGSSSPAPQHPPVAGTLLLAEATLSEIEEKPAAPAAGADLG